MIKVATVNNSDGNKFSLELEEALNKFESEGYETEIKFL